MGNIKLDEYCKYKDLCEEMYCDNEDFKCQGRNNCEHYDAYLEGECWTIESEGML